MVGIVRVVFKINAAPGSINNRQADFYLPRCTVRDVAHKTATRRRLIIRNQISSFYQTIRAQDTERWHFAT